MTVFRGYMTIVKRNLGILIMYLTIFMTITIIIQFSYMHDKEQENFQSTKLKIAIIDRDKSSLSKGVTSYLKEQHNYVKMEDNKGQLQEALFYRNVDYIVIIPKNFEADFLEQDAKILTTKVPGSFSGYYVDQQLDSYLNNIRVYNASGYSVGESVELTGEQAKAVPKVTLLDKSENGGEAPGYSYMFRYMPYLFISVLCYAMSIVLVEFRNQEVKRRMLCSSVSIRKQNSQAILAFLIVGIVDWCICMLLPIVMYQKEFLASNNLKYYFANSFTFMVVSLALSFLVGVCAKNTNVINNIVNVISLGLCFLGGVFVPIYMLGKGVKKVSQFLPTYWYEEANDLLANYGTLTPQFSQQVWKSIGIQLIFAFACTGVALAIVKYQQQD